MTCDIQKVLIVKIHYSQFLRGASRSSVSLTALETAAFVEYL